jgi:hypothetical protein
MIYINMKSVLFPVYGSYPYVLNIGHSDQEKKSVDGKKILFILDSTGSMGEFINEKQECSKSIMAKNLIKKVMQIRDKNDYDIMQFNEKTYPLCKIDEIKHPEKCTYFTPLVPEVKSLLNEKSNYCAVVFMSDGLPSEDYGLARNAIKQIGNITREFGANPISVAIGRDADGEACGLFAGNRGFNCFIRYNRELEKIAEDISKGIDCNYNLLDNGMVVPIEDDGNYYYVDEDEVGETIRPTRQLLEKYLNLVIQRYITDTKHLTLLRSLVDHCVKLLDNEDEQKAVCTHYYELLEDVKHTVREEFNTPGMLSAVATVFRNKSSQV